MAARKRVSTEGLSDGWLLDSSGALYDVRFRASTTRVALLSVGARGPALEAFFVGHFEARTPQIYAEWNRRRRGFASGRRRL